MRRAFVFGADKSAHRLVGAIFFGCLGGAAAVSCSSSSSDAPHIMNNLDGGFFMDDSTLPDHKDTGTQGSGNDANGNETGDVMSDTLTEATADVSPDVPSEAAPEAGGDATADGSGDAPVDVAIDHCASLCGSPGVCTDTNADPNHCGSCTNACGLGGTCSNGQCVCTGGATKCGTKCIDPTQDPNNCGTCGTVCNNGYCSTTGSVTSCKNPAQVATSGGTIEQIALDQSGDIFWTVGGTSGGLYAKILSGGGTITVEAPLPYPIAVTVSKSNVLYWGDYNTGEIDSMTTAKALGIPAITTIVPAPDAASPQPVAIAADTVNVYWADNGAGTINQAPKGGGTVITIASNQSQPIAIKVDANNIYWINNGTGVADGAIMSAPIWSSDGGSPVVDAGTLDDSGADAGDGGSPEAGTNITTLASGQTLPQGLAVDGTYVYWTSNLNPGPVQAVPKSSTGGGVPITIADSQPTPYGIVVDGNTVTGNRYVYWTNRADDSVFRAPVPAGSGSGGPPMQIASGQNVPQAMDIDPTSTYVYWANTGNGQIMRVQVH